MTPNATRSSKISPRRRSDLPGACHTLRPTGWTGWTGWRSARLARESIVIRPRPAPWDSASGVLPRGFGLRSSASGVLPQEFCLRSSASGVRPRGVGLGASASDVPLLPGLRLSATPEPPVAVHPISEHPHPPPDAPAQPIRYLDTVAVPLDRTGVAPQQEALGPGFMPHLPAPEWLRRMMLRAVHWPIASKTGCNRPGIVAARPGATATAPSIAPDITRTFEASPDSADPPSRQGPVRIIRVMRTDRVHQVVGIFYILRYAGFSPVDNSLWLNIFVKWHATCS
jgi:hypothetical protein